MVRSARAVMLVVLAMATVGCAARVHERLKTSGGPRTIAVVVGHDINSIASMTTGEEILVALSLGIVGSGIAAATAEKQALPFEAELRDHVVGRLVGQLEGKGYRAQVVAQKPKKWDLFGNISDGPDVYRNLLRDHALHARDVEAFDAVLFVEYWVEGRLEGRFLSKPNPEDLSLARMKPKYAKAKLFLYDRQTATRLYFDSFQRGYPAFTDATLETALETITDLTAVPARVKSDGG
jgi:hypothetical protein